MSCGNPHELDCRDVLQTVYVYLDHECDDGQRAKIKHHLEECGPCLRQFGIEAEVKALVHRCCRSETAPFDLRDRVMEKLRRAGVEH